MKVSFVEKKDWWLGLTDEQKSGISRGLKDIGERRTIPHEIVKQRYEL